MPAGPEALTSLGEEAAACTEATYLSTSGFVRRIMAPSPAVRPVLVVGDRAEPRQEKEEAAEGRHSYVTQVPAPHTAERPPLPIAATRDVTASPWDGARAERAHAR